jgi:hypothetical protein
LASNFNKNERRTPEGICLRRISEEENVCGNRRGEEKEYQNYKLPITRFFGE